MSYAELTHHNPFLIFRMSHGARYRRSVVMIDPKPGQRVLDYGCGDGYILGLMAGSGAELFGYDPSLEMRASVSQIAGVQCVSDVAELPAGAFDTVSVFEVLEHVSTTETDTILNRCRRLLKADGKLIVSVPLEIGLASLVKNTIRAAVVRPVEVNNTPLNRAKTALRIPIERHDYGNGYFGHMGFDYRQLEPTFTRCGLKIERRTFSPVPILRSLINSQVFYVLRPQ